MIKSSDQGTNSKERKKKTPPGIRQKTNYSRAVFITTQYFSALPERQLEERQNIAGFLKWHKVSVFQQLNPAFNFRWLSLTEYIPLSLMVV